MRGKQKQWPTDSPSQTLHLTHRNPGETLERFSVKGELSTTSHFGFKIKPLHCLKHQPELPGCLSLRNINNSETFLEQTFPTGIKRRQAHGSLEEDKMAMSGFQKRSNLGMEAHAFHPALGN